MAVLVIVGRDMGRGAGEESVVAEDIAADELLKGLRETKKGNDISLLMFLIP